MLCQLRGFCALRRRPVLPRHRSLLQHLDGCRGEVRRRTGSRERGDGVVELVCAPGCMNATCLEEDVHERRELGAEVVRERAADDLFGVEARSEGAELE